MDNILRKLPVDLGEHLHISFPLAHLREVKTPFGWADVRPYNRLFFVLKAPSGGGGDIRDAFGRQRLVLKKNTVLYMPPQTFVDCRYRPGVMVAAFHVQAELFHGNDLFLGQTRFLAIHDVHIADRMMEPVGKRSVGSALAMRSICLDIISRVADMLGVEVDKTLQLEARHGELLRIIRTHPGYGLRVGDLAQRLGGNRVRLSRDFAREAGLPLKKYIDRAVLEEAKRLLMYSRLSVRQIADRLEFPDEFFFSHFFKRRTGRSPVQWRDTARSREPFES
ncbi:MAG: helix-turn-helix transcriptional regulator [Spirochaetes bacterium]|nr:helix-turn-helix transcriptional regulator [Spirochaetota bacterium]